MKKPWCRKIKDHIEHWSGSLSGHSWWPKYVYFFTDLRNAVSILEKDCLLSRDQAENLGYIEVNGANQEIISQTIEERRKFVRLYYPAVLSASNTNAISMRGNQTPERKNGKNGVKSTIDPCQIKEKMGSSLL